MRERKASWLLLCVLFAWASACVLQTEPKNAFGKPEGSGGSPDAGTADTDR